MHLLDDNRHRERWKPAKESSSRHHPPDGSIALTIRDEHWTRVYFH